jgi:iron complex outermembrane recepter protein
MTNSKKDKQGGKILSLFMRLKPVLIFICFFSLQANAGNFATSLSGIVTGNGNPMPGVSIVINPGGQGATTDENGKYSVNLNPGTYKVTFSFVGFTAKTVTVTIAENTDKVLNVQLQPNEQTSEAVVVVGSRSQPRSSVNTPLPVDNVDAATLKSTGQPSFDKALQYRVPSFNTVNTPVNDASTLLDPYEIRNLGPSRTLILINGKRKNLSSLLYVQFSPGRGETGADLSAIPVDAIKNVEILRDGASAQYGSDAIAGVMNVILKDKYQYSSVNFNAGVTGKGDGGTYGISFNSGSNIGSRGFVNYTAALGQQNNAVRSGIIDIPTEIATFSGGPAGDAAIKAFLAKYPTGKNTNGTGITTSAKFLVNMGLPVGETGLFYGNAAFVAKKVISNANYRTPYWRTDAGLLHTRIPGAPNYTGGTDPLYEGYLGYEPTFEGDLTDYNGTIGFKNETNGWKHDISFTVGGNQQIYSVNNTVNRGFGAKSPTSFKPGGFNFSNIVGNIDISKSVSDNVSIGFGTEVRTETFKIFAGDTASYKGEGSNSFPGIDLVNARTNSRFNLGGYFDVSADLTKDFLVNATMRAERYSDFGNAFVWKVSSRYKFLEDKLTFRGSVSTGFRAPTLHQIYTQSTQASFAGGTIVTSGLFNNGSKEAFALGIPKLTAEKSTNFTLGIGLKPNKNLNITLDYYNIDIKDRIVYSSSITSADRLLATPLTELGRILKGNSTGAGNADLKSVQFFINGIKTRTSGLDLVVNYKNIALGTGKLAINLAGNYTLNNEIIGNPVTPKAISDAGSSILNVQIKSLLTESRPRFKAILGFDYTIEKFNFNLNNTLFGPTKFQDLDNGPAYTDIGLAAPASGDRNVMNDIKQVFSTALVTDLNIGYNFSDKIALNVTANNLFNVLPKWKLEALNSDANAVLNNAAAKNLVEGFLSFSGRYRILGYNGSQFSQLGSIFSATLSLKF